MTHEKMGYFKDWKFGVPVTVHHCGLRIFDETIARLVYEDCSMFTVVLTSRDGRAGFVDVNGFIVFSDSFDKETHSYIPIPYKVDIMQPRFPVCVNRCYTAYCNKGAKMTSLALVGSNVHITEVKELEGAKCSAKT